MLPKLTIPQPKTTYTISPKFWLWRQVPEKWQVTRGFMVWLFLEYWLLNKKEENKIWKNHFPEFFPPYFPLWGAMCPLQPAKLGHVLKNSNLLKKTNKKRKDFYKNPKAIFKRPINSKIFIGKYQGCPLITVFLIEEIVIFRWSFLTEQPLER